MIAWHSRSIAGSLTEQVTRFAAVLTITWWHGSVCAQTELTTLEDYERRAYEIFEEAQHSGGRNSYQVQAGIALADEGVGLAQEASQPLMKARLLQARWVYTHLTGNHSRGIELLEAAARLAREERATDDVVAGYLKNLSYSHVLSGNFAQGTRLLRECIVLHRDSGEAIALAEDFLSIADAYLKSGERDLAGRYFEEALGVSPEDSIWRYGALSKLGTIDRERGDLPAAFEKHESAHAFFAREGRYREVVVAIELAKDHLANDDLSQAASFALAVERDRRSLDQHRLDSSLILIEVHRRTHDFDEAARYLQLARQIVTNSQSNGAVLVFPLRQLEIARQGVLLNEALGNAADAVASGEQGMNVADTIRGEVTASAGASKAWTARITPFLSDYLSLLLDAEPQRIPEVLEQAYTWKTHYEDPGLLDSMVAQNERISLLNDFLDAERAVVAALEEARSKKSDAIDTILSETQRARDRARDLYLAGVPDSDSIVVPRERKEKAAIESGDLVLRYYVQERISFVLGQDQSGDRFHRLPPAKELLRTIDHTLIALDPRSGVSRRQQEQALQALGSIILPSSWLANHIYDRIIVVPDDNTHRVPFGALDVEGGSYTPLNDRVNWVRADSSSQFYGSERPHPSSSSGDVVVIADPEFAVLAAESETRGSDFRSWTKGLSRLPYTAREAADIAQVFAENSVRTYLGASATRDRLLSEEARNARILHIATHGYFDVDTPDIVGLAMAGTNGQDGLLTLTELMSRDFNNELVVISGCETILGRPYAGLGVMSLAQGFLSRGAGAVVGTLWKVPDRATSVFMNEFYRSLKANSGDLAQALDEAKSTMRRSGRFSMPYYWAGFTLSAASSEQLVLTGL
ncbi:MAG: CHAT domain-containing protein [Pseudomonadota bacterium]